MPMVYDDDIEDKIDAISEQFRVKYPDMENMRWHAIKTLEQDDSVTKKYPVDMTGIADRSYEKDIINEKYDFIEEVIDETLVNKSAKAEQTDRIDRFMTSRWLGLPIFLVIMALVFFLTFTVGDWLKGYFETGLDLLTGAVSAGLEGGRNISNAQFTAGGRYHLRCGRHPYFSAEYLYPVPRARVPRGQRLYVACGVCHG